MQMKNQFCSKEICCNLTKKVPEVPQHNGIMLCIKTINIIKEKSKISGIFIS